jgi:hypothetical protein
MVLVPSAEVTVKLAAQKAKNRQVKNISHRSRRAATFVADGPMCAGVNSSLWFVAISVGSSKAAV